MTPAARAAAAITVLDDILAGETAEKCLSRWGRNNRYAGSKDRAAVRDYVFDVLRQKRSLAARGGAATGRGLILGLLRRQGIDPASVFGAGGYGPEELSADEIKQGADPQSDAEKYDFPDWLWPVWERNLGAQAIESAKVLQNRGPITLRVNLRRGTVAQAQDVLAQEGIVTTPVAHVKTALQVIENERRVNGSRAFQEGLVELQDVASQEAVAALQLSPKSRVLDYCAGGGGKAIAIADMYDCQVFAHDIAAARTVDIAPRASRAGIDVSVLLTDEIKDHAPFEVVFVDAPCSGSGTWRRAPEAKWAMTPTKLNEYSSLQQDVIKESSRFVGAGGQMIYATCSVFASENGDVVNAFLSENPDWKMVKSHQRIPDVLGDGFYYAVLSRG